MTSVSIPNGRKKTTVESSAAMKNAPHHVRKKPKNAWKMPPKLTEDGRAVVRFTPRQG